MKVRIVGFGGDSAMGFFLQMGKNSSFIIHPCSLAGLVIEVDGDIHDLQKEEDERREKALSELGLRVVRFGNEEVGGNLSAVVGKIREYVEK